MKILNKKQSIKAIKTGLVNKDECFDIANINLPDGNRNAERVLISKNIKTGMIRYRICAPWLLVGIF